MGILGNVFPGIAAKRAEAKLRLEEAGIKQDVLMAKRAMLDGVISQSGMGQTNSGYSQQGLVHELPCRGSSSSQHKD